MVGQQKRIRQRNSNFLSGSDWKHNVERMEMFFEVNNVSEAKKVPTILTLMGNKMYALLRSIVSPRGPKDLSFTEIVDNLAKHLDPKPIVIAERFKFYKAEQQKSEAIRDFIARLKKLAETFPDSRGTRKEFIVPVAIDGRTVDMELDTGASVTIIPKSIWTDVLASKPVERTDVKLRSYSGQEIPVIGEARVQVAYRDQEAVLPVVITGNDGPALVGRDWLSVLKLDWGHIKQISLKSVNKLDWLRTKYSSLFDGNLGTIKRVTAHLKLNENAVPQFFKHRPVPFALKEKIADELRRLEKIGELEKVDFSDWATPIVPVLKPDGSVRICGDYKVTINPVLDVPEHPMPTADDLFTQLNGGESLPSWTCLQRTSKCFWMRNRDST
ncbi:Uncharacterized protein K02A2.6 [Stylophora pistillata]|uniref:Uncharacterized protein K02A2.6 n=1 Tax=Stylophora pistillata TaxID=50429 RepID=A0A2B4S0G7_STYPI|nr:Uncharacterized protein K02A2.6 [Stylophora pistillata]